MTPRRRRNSLNDPVVVGWTIERAVRDQIAAVASRAGISTSALVQMLCERVELDERGIPAWLEANAEELPIDTR